MARRTRAPSVEDQYVALMSLIRSEVEDEELRGRLVIAADNLHEAWIDATKTEASRQSRMLRAR